MNYPIQRHKKVITIADSQTVGSDNNNLLNGILLGVLADVPQLDGSTTVTVDILDADGFTIFTKATIAENAKTALFLDANSNPIQLPLSGNHTIRVTVTNAQSGGNDSVTVTLLINNGT